MRKTNILIVLSGGNLSHPSHYRVKLNSKYFPYIVIHNEMILIGNKNPEFIQGPWGIEKYKVESITNKDQLSLVLDNPELTLNKLTIKQRTRLSS